MGILIILIPVLVALFIINEYLKKKNKKIINENMALPISLFIIMCITAYVISAPFILVIIFFVFGLIIASTIENYNK